MVITNRFVTKIVGWFVRDKTKKFSFSFEQEVYETDVLDQTYVRHYITALQSAVDEEIEHLTEEYKL